MHDEIKTQPTPGARAGVHLTIITANGTQQRALEGRREVTIGRSRSADVTIDDGSISRIHARLQLTSGRTTDPEIVFTDLGSSNGSTVRGAPASPNEPITVGPGELLELGSVVVIVHRGASGAAVDASVRIELPTSKTVMDAVRDAGRKAALHALNVLILGETGVGKGVMAREIHALSPRAKGPFVVVDCTAIASEIADSELFGHEEGAFTSARAAKPGLLEVADGGTAFIDEIGELPAALQAKLLRAIEDRTIRRVGGVTERQIDVRFIAATNRDLDTEVAAGRFRQDLLFRLNAVTLPIPPLRQRTAEIVPLAEGFAAGLSGGTPVRLDTEVATWLTAQPWPGNVRQLRNAVERAFAEAGGRPLGLPDFQTLIPPEPRDAPGPVEPSASPDAHSERERIVAALEACAGNQTKAAAALGISRRTLIHRLDQYGLPRPRKRR